MKTKVKFTYVESYLPPRCRKYRERNVEGILEVEVKELASAPIAFIVHQYVSRPATFEIERENIYAVDGQLFKRVMERGTRGPEPVSVSDSRLLDFYLKYGLWGRQSKEESEESIKDNANKHVIIDGYLCELCGEPMYHVQTFGLGHNHGGTGFFIDNCYNSNCSWKSYFPANKRDEALAYFKEVALGRGDTKSVRDEEEPRNIEVLMPEMVKRRPEKEAGEGDEFLNAVDNITAAADSSLEAGLLAMALLR